MSSSFHHLLSIVRAPRRRRRGPIPTGTTALPKRDGDEFCTGDLPAACRAVTKLPGAGTAPGQGGGPGSPASHPWWRAVFLVVVAWTLHDLADLLC